MATNLAIDTDLLDQALQIGRFDTKKDAVNQALKEFVNWRKQLEIVELFDSFDPDPEYDYKAARRR